MSCWTTPRAGCSGSSRYGQIDPPKSPGLRVFVEDVVIVGSILLAFGIQAWWEGLGVRVQDQALLAGLCVGVPDCR